MRSTFESEACRGWASFHDGPVPRIPLRVFRLLLLIGLAASIRPNARAADDVAGAWELVARHLPGDAQARLAPPAIAGREAALARAAVAMDSQPMTDERLTTVVTQLAELARGDDEVGQAAAYLVGRMYQVHFFQPDPARAARAYEELVARHPDSYWAQLARVKLAVLRLYLLPEPAAPAARVEAAEALLAQVTVPELRRDLHIVIGRARLFHRLPGALPHLREAARIGGTAAQAAERGRAGSD